MPDLLRIPSSRVFALCLVGFALLLGGCAGSDKPKPAQLGANVPLMGIKQVWSNAIGTVGFPLDIHVVGSQVFVASSNGTVAAIETSTGADVWRVNLATPLSAGVGSDGRISAVVSKENILIVLDGSKVLWRQKLAASTLTAPFVAGGRIFTLSSDRTTMAFDALTGRRLWQQQRSGDALVLGQAGLLLGVGDTLVAGVSGKLVGMNALNGVVKWESSLANSRGTNEVERLVDVVAGYSRVGDQVCARAFQYAVACVDAASGRGTWSKPANGNTGIAGNFDILIGSEADGKVASWRRFDGERLWTSERLRFRVLSAPLLLGRAVVIGDDSGILHFLSKDDGSPLNRIQLDSSGISATPVLAQQALVVVTRNGNVLGFRPD
jgi:outer membrane assembly lipoprotein YfgL